MRSPELESLALSVRRSACSRSAAVRAMPGSWSKRRRAAMAGAWCASKPDADNIAGAVMDALFEDDAAVVAVSCSKLWGPAGELRIEIRTAALGAA